MEQGGEGLLASEERLRALAKQMRAEGVDADEASRAEAELWERTQHLDGRELVGVIRAFSVFFQLVNTADQHHRVRRRRWRDAEREEAHRAQPESLAAAFAAFAERAVPPERIRSVLDRLSIELVVTPHPTEVSRRTVLAKHMLVAECLDSLDNPSLSPRERRETQERLLEEITILWQSDEMRSARPRVIDEVRRALFFFEEVLFDTTGTVHEELERLLDRHYPGAAPAGGLPALRLLGRRRPGRQPQLHARVAGGGARPARRPRPPDAAGAGAGAGRGHRHLHAHGAGQRGARRLDRRRRGGDARDRRGDGRSQRLRAVPAQAVVRVGAPGPARRAALRAAGRAGGGPGGDAALAGGARRAAPRGAQPGAADAAGADLRLPHRAPRRAPALEPAEGGRRGPRGARRRWRPAGGRADPDAGGSARASLGPRRAPDAGGPLRRDRAHLHRAAPGGARARARGRRDRDRELHPGALRHPGRPGAGHGRRAVPGGGRRLPLRRRPGAPVRDHRRPAPRAGHAARPAAPARVPAQPGGARQPPGGDGRLLRLQQGRRLPCRQLGAAAGPGAPGGRLPPEPRRRWRSSTGAGGRPAAAAAPPTRP